jgi:hypothetical protein
MAVESEVARLRLEAAAHREAAQRLRESKLFQRALFAPLGSQPTGARPPDHGDSEGEPPLAGRPRAVTPSLPGTSRARGLGLGQDAAPRDLVTWTHGPVPFAVLAAAREKAAAAVQAARQAGRAAREARRRPQAQAQAPGASPGQPPAVVQAMQARAESLRLRRTNLEARRRQAARDAVASLNQALQAAKVDVGRARSGRFPSDSAAGPGDGGAPHSLAWPGDGSDSDSDFGSGSGSGSDSDSVGGRGCGRRTGSRGRGSCSSGSGSGSGSGGSRGGLGLGVGGRGAARGRAAPNEWGSGTSEHDDSEDGVGPAEDAYSGLTAAQAALLRAIHQPGAGLPCPPHHLHCAPHVPHTRRSRAYDWECRVTCT